MASGIFGLLPIAAFISIFVLLHCHLKYANGNRTNIDWRYSLACSSIVWSVYAILSSELLTLAKRLSFNGVVFVWLSALLVAVFLIIKNRSWKFINKRRQKGILADSLKWTPTLIAYCSAIATFIFLIGIVAWRAAPSTYDALAYHLPRICHWIQNHGLQNYATIELAQLVQPPGGEILMLQFQVLTNSDMYANLVQWFSMVLCVCGVSLMAKVYGAELYGQIVSALLCVLIPIGIVQASTSKNDCIVSVWLMYSFLFSQKYLKKHQMLDLVWLSLSIGLALLTKASSFVFLVPLIMFLIVKEFRGFKTSFSKLLLAVCIGIVCVNAGFWFRMIDLLGFQRIFGIVKGPEIMHRLTMELITPQTFFSNLLRNLGLHFGTPIQCVNRWILAAIEQCHQWMNLSMTDPRTTYGPFALDNTFSRSEISAGNFTHMILALCFLMVGILQKRRRANEAFQTLALGFGGFLFFCLTIKWDVWHSRSQLPLFVIWCASLGYFLGKFKRRWLVDAVLTTLIVFSTTYILQSDERPVFGAQSIFKKSRNEQYFRLQPDAYNAFVNMSSLVNDYPAHDIGLISHPFQLEYFYWVVLKGMEVGSIRFNHYKVDNLSKKYETDYRPDVVISTVVDAKVIDYLSRNFEYRQFESQCCVVFLKPKPQSK